MRVLVACEYSGRVRDAFLAGGHDAMSCDLRIAMLTRRVRVLEGSPRYVPEDTQ